jgi:sucrose-6-phosphate hydrolase SacC (GH32 family)
MGPMFSGSAVVDWTNTSGLGQVGTPPIVLLYTAAGNPAVQCLAYSTDGGKTFAKYAGNPVVKQITGGNRDPKVIWHEPAKRWVMTLYVELKGKHTIHFLTSPNLKEWKVQSQIEGFFECPDFFELPVEGGGQKKKWVLTAASSEYMIGTFDGVRFTPETPKLSGQRGRGFYAAQTFSDIPTKDGRRIQIGWLQAPSPGMPFNQAMTVPLVLKLVSTPDGPRLSWQPVRELEALRGQAARSGKLLLNPGDANPCRAAAGEQWDLIALVEPGKATEVAFTIRGSAVVYDVRKQELVLSGHRAAAPLRDGKLDLRILADRTAFEIFAGGGLTYVPMPVIPKAKDRFVAVSVQGGPAIFHALDLYEMTSMWPEKSPSKSK